VAQAEFTLFGVTLHCHVLSDGQRVIQEDDLRKLLLAMLTGSIVDDPREYATLGALTQWMHRP
jgi:hypothetical protein